MKDTRLYGVRHHGPGCARSLLSALHEFDPEVLLVEGLPESEPLLTWMRHEELEPPVAMLAYATADPTQAVFGPFAEFSPEWVAIRWALSRGVPVKMIDMPAAHTLAPREAGLFGFESTEPPRDPLGWLATATGYDDGERWWEHMVEERLDPAGLFEGIAELMEMARAELGEPTDERELQREAFMRQGIRQAEKSHRRVAVVVGAMHVPALSARDRIKASADAALIRGLPKVKVQVAWIPWTYDRIAASSGYGAGVISPAYYEHLWRSKPVQLATGWILQAARLLREEDLDASPASAIEAVRLADALAAIRGRQHPGLQELQEAVASVLAEGHDAPMQLIRRKLIVGQRMGAIPNKMPGLPIQQDLNDHLKRLRLKLDVEEKPLELDLRSEFDLARSHLLHRLNVLSVPWGEAKEVRGKAGTFHEHWRLEWRPEYALAVVEASRWGTTIEIAANKLVVLALEQPRSLAQVTQRLDEAILARLEDALPIILTKLQTAAAIATDVTQILDGIPAVARALTYGSVRQTDATTLRAVFDGLVARASINLPLAARGLDDEAAERLAELIDLVHPSVAHAEGSEAWLGALRQIMDDRDAHGLLVGRITRLLFDAGSLEQDEMATRCARVLTPGIPHRYAAAWIEGFLAGSALALIHDEALFDRLDQWLQSLPAETFDETLPLLRRTFAAYTAPERRQIAEVVSAGVGAKVEVAPTLDAGRVALVMPFLDQLLGGVSDGK